MPSQNKALAIQTQLSLYQGSEMITFHQCTDSNMELRSLYRNREQLLLIDLHEQKKDMPICKRFVASAMPGTLPENSGKNTSAFTQRAARPTMQT